MYNATYTFSGTATTDYKFIGWYTYNAAKTTASAAIGSSVNIASSSTNVAWNSARYTQTHIYAIFVPITKDITIAMHDGMSDGWTLKDTKNNANLTSAYKATQKYFNQTTGAYVTSTVTISSASQEIYTFEGASITVSGTLATNYTAVGAYAGLIATSDVWYTSATSATGVSRTAFTASPFSATYSTNTSLATDTVVLWVRIVQTA
jgi:hypothetical protein